MARGITTPRFNRPSALWQLLLTACLGILLNGCGFDREDARSYPIIWKTEHTFPEYVTAVDAIQLPGVDEDVLLQAYFDSKAHEIYIFSCSSVTDVVFDQMILDTSPHGLVEYTRKYRWLGVADGDLDNVKEGYFAVFSKKSALIVQYDAQEKDTTHVFNYIYPENLEDEKPVDLTISSIFTINENESEGAAFWFRLYFGYVNLPRTLYIMNSLVPFRPRTVFSSGSPLVLKESYDLDSDGINEYLLSSDIPSNGRVHNGLDDRHGYFVALKEDGNPYWVNDLGAAGGSTRLFLDHFKETKLYGIFSKETFDTPFDLHTLYQLDVKTGKILSEKTFNGEVVALPVKLQDQEHWLFFADQVEETCSILDRDFNTTYHQKNLRGSVQLHSFLSHPGHEDLVTLLLARKGGLHLLTNIELEPVSLMNNLPRHYEPLKTSGRNLYLASEGQNIEILRAVYQPFWLWWSWRYRWILVILVLPPVIFLTVYFIYKYIRTRRRATIELHKTNRELENAKKKTEEINLQLNESNLELAKNLETLHRLMERYYDQDEELRKDIAHNFHDEVGQMLSAIKLELSLHTHDLFQIGPKYVKWMDGVLRHINQTIESAHTIIQGLRPTMLDDFGLVETLEWHCKEFERMTKIACSVNLEVQEYTFSKRADIQIYRIVKEALNNASKHAKCDYTEVDMRANADTLTLTILDNGEGMGTNGKPESNGLGLFGIAERAKFLGGTLTIDSTKTEGTTIRLTVPIENVCIPDTKMKQSD
ncbi:sensor histidine kinase [bacterium]|nr:sensor histidine kinase [bacterium]